MRRFRHSAAESADSGVQFDRRTFLTLAAATGAGLHLTQPVGAEIQDPRLTDSCQFVINHTPDSYETPVVVSFDDTATASWFDDRFTDEDRRPTEPEKTVIRHSPAPAGHGLLTAGEMTVLLEESGVDSIDFSPGANPFWTLPESYDDGVFPDPVDARGYLAYDEVVAGLDHLETEYSSRVSSRTIGQSPGWTDLVDGDDEEWGVRVTEVTENVDGRTADKETVVYSLCIHGDERAGAEAGYRFLERAARGDLPDRLLEAVVLVFLLTNPDGWISREPWTEIDHVSHDRNFQRGNGGNYNGVIDTNRQYPTVGWINPDFLPAEPNGAPEFFADEIPDALAIVEELRSYENVAAMIDYHGMYTADHMVYNLEGNGPLDHGQMHVLDELGRETGRALQSRWGDVDAISDDISDAAEREYGQPFVPSGDQFGGLFDWGTIYDTIDYQVTGGAVGWASTAEEFGGLGAVAIAPEIIVSNNTSWSIKEWKPWWSRHYVTAYSNSIARTAGLAAVETEATVASGDRDTAYIDSDTLVRSSDDLPYTGPDATTAETTVRSARETIDSADDTVTVGSTANARELSITVESTGGAGRVRLRHPDGSLHRSVDVGTIGQGGRARRELSVKAPDAGEWTIEADTAVAVEVSVLDATSEYPDPREAWQGDGFEQTPYEATPMGFFDDLAAFLEDGTLEGIDQDQVGSGELEDYHQLVIAHDDGIDDEAYLDALEAFLAAGGDLVVTDTGLHLLGALDTVDIEPGDITDTTSQFATLDWRVSDHPLLQGVRDRQQELYKGAQIGYTTATDQPATLVDPAAFTDAGGDIAARIDGNVALGRLEVGQATIDCIGSILPPAQQTVLHPFGLADHAVSSMGHTVLCNALGFEQRRYVAGELVRTIGPDRRGVTRTLGDVDGDGEITIVDAALIQQYLAEMDPEPFDENLADVDRDGEVTIVDAALIQQYLAGLVEKGTVELLGASATAGGGELEVEVEVENPNGMGAIEEVEVRLAETDDDLPTAPTRALLAADPGPEDTETFTATIETVNLSAGTYAYGVYCDDQEITGTVTVP